MTSFYDDNVSVFGDYRRICLLLCGECRLGEDHIQLRQDLHIPDDLLRIGTEKVGKHHKHALDLPLFLLLQFFQLIVGFHNGHGLDEECCTAGRLTVDQTLDLTAEFLLDGNHKTTVAHGNDLILQIFGVFPRTDEGS